MVDMAYSQYFFLKIRGVSRKLWMQKRIKYGTISTQLRRITVMLNPLSLPRINWNRYMSGTAANTTIQKRANPFISILVPLIIVRKVSTFFGRFRGVRLKKQPARSKNERQIVESARFMIIIAKVKINILLCA